MKSDETMEGSMGQINYNIYSFALPVYGNQSVDPEVFGRAHLEDVTELGLQRTRYQL